MSGTPTGTVQFYANGTALGSARVSFFGDGHDCSATFHLSRDLLHYSDVFGRQQLCGFDGGAGIFS